ncbi:dienelactone hydrolase family protein [Sphingomonas sp. AP4-R1]|uniref:dienelactone hydrolase family protein n=1 Tax=Sphingomonas sp. AP4-R1 TaxID=2735134 RepID=UPI0015978481|nr:dienelactone hydrolase family protein [Sphingomonas sp. AP4-R1]QJU56606.1 dienelactone hydrolase family protein [Sphingomonas sp. AP4-R1]
MAEMPESTAFSREILDLFDAFVHGGISRRGFIEKATTLTGSVAAATTILSALSPDFASAEVIAPADKRITVETVTIPSPQGDGTIKAYVAKPAGTSPKKKKPVVLVVHENRGLNPHIEDIARRLAVDGFIAVAPDALTSLGGYPGTEDEARALFPKLDQAKVQMDFLAAAAYAQALPDGTGKLGAVGFCYGGGIVNMLATKVPTLRAAVPFYGAPPKLEDVPAIKAELLVQHAGNDTRLAGTWPDYDKALTAAGVRHEGFIYPGVEHGFNNDTTPRFNKAAADLAWNRTIALFKRTLA